MSEIELPSTRSIGIKYGAIQGFIGIIMFIGTDLTGNVGNQAIQWISLAIFLGVLYMAFQEYKKLGDGFMSFGQGTGIGTWAVLISSLINAPFSYIYISFVNPTIIDTIREQQIMQFEEQGMSDAQIEQTMEFTSMFLSPGAIALMGLIFGFIFGFIATLIMAAILKKNRPEFE